MRVAAVLVRSSPLMVAALLLCTACAEPERPSGRSWSVRTHPRAADRYARLERAFLTAADAPAAKQALVCEHARLADALGPLEAGRRIAGVDDSLLRASAARAAFERADAASGMHAYEMAGRLCNSLKAAAEREDGPIRPAPESLRER